MQSPAKETFTDKGSGVGVGVGVAVGSGVGVGVGEGVVSSGVVSGAAVVSVKETSVLVSVPGMFLFKPLKAQPAKTAAARMTPAVIIVLRIVVHLKLNCSIL